MNNFSYPLGVFGWRVWSAFGLPVAIYVDVNFDKDAGVYVATGRHMRGLVIEAASLDAVKLEIEHVMSDLLRLNYPTLSAKPQHTNLHINAALA